MATRLASQTAFHRISSKVAPERFAERASLATSRTSFSRSGAMRSISLRILTAKTLRVLSASPPRRSLTRVFASPRASQPCRIRCQVNYFGPVSISPCFPAQIKSRRLVRQTLGAGYSFPVPFTRTGFYAPVCTRRIRAKHRRTPGSRGTLLHACATL